MCEDDKGCISRSSAHRWKCCTGTFVAVRGERTFPCRPGDAVSVFAPLPGTRATSRGLAWPLDGVDLTPLWRGTLNRATADRIRLTFSHPAPALVVLG